MMTNTKNTNLTISKKMSLNIRTLSDKVQEELFPNYHRQLRLLKDLENDQIDTYVNDTDCAQIYQYYSISPNCMMEARMLKRMNLAVSIVCLRETIFDYLNKPVMPRVMRNLFYYYLVQFLNSMDYIVVVRQENIERLQKEGVTGPKFYYVDESDSRKAASQWLGIYRDSIRNN